MYLEEITNYKKIVLECLWGNEDVKGLVLSKDMTYDTFRKHIFPYGKNPNTITEQGTYILFDVDPKKGSHENLVKYTLYFYIISHDAINLTPNGVRVDILTNEIEKVFFDSRKFGIGKLDYGGAPTFSTPSGFYGRTLTYYTTEFRGAV